MKVFRVIGMLALCLVLCSCAGKQQLSEQEQSKYANVSRIEGVSIETVQKEPKVASGYENIILKSLQMKSQFSTDYPQMASQFNVSLLSYLKDKNAYTHVEEERHLKDHKFNTNKKTLIVDVTVVDMRIVSTGARIWAGAMAGSSFVELYLKLTDASSQKIVHEKIIATSYNAFGSAWSMGGENALPYDMGKIIGEYISTVVPTK